jgi:hypothetical protein
LAVFISDFCAVFSLFVTNRKVNAGNLRCTSLNDSDALNKYSLAKTSLHTASSQPRQIPFLATNPSSAMKIAEGMFHARTEGFVSEF